MKEYKFVRIHDDSQPDDHSRLEAFVDTLPEHERRFLYSATQHGGFLSLVWNNHSPRSWQKKNAVDVNWAGGADTWGVASIEQNPPRLPESLQRCLAALKKMKEGEIAEVTKDDRALITTANLRTLELCAMLTLKCDLKIVEPQNLFANPGHMSFQSTILDYEITPEGEKQLQG